MDFKKNLKPRFPLLGVSESTEVLGLAGRARGRYQHPQWGGKPRSDRDDMLSQRGDQEWTSGSKPRSDRGSAVREQQDQAPGKSHAQELRETEAGRCTSGSGAATAPAEHPRTGQRAGARLVECRRTRRLAAAPRPRRESACTARTLWVSHPFDEDSVLWTPSEHRHP